MWLFFVAPPPCDFCSLPSSPFWQTPGMWGCVGTSAAGLGFTRWGIERPAPRSPAARRCSRCLTVRTHPEHAPPRRAAHWGAPSDIGLAAWRAWPRAQKL